uniref:Uncharacterized protein n=1 Tax=Pseudonaja textilis TaxID=8673 RepID=A0A670ZK21_PSETE
MAAEKIYHRCPYNQKTGHFAHWPKCTSRSLEPYYRPTVSGSSSTLKERLFWRTGTLAEEGTSPNTAQPDQLEILKQFDLNWQYGPCSAKFLGLNPPTTVQDLLLKYNNDPFVIYSLWKLHENQCVLTQLPNA